MERVIRADKVTANPAARTRGATGDGATMADAATETPTSPLAVANAPTTPVVAAMRMADAVATALEVSMAVADGEARRGSVEAARAASASVR